MTHTVEKKSLCAESAQAMIAAATAKAKELGVPETIAVVDESGLLKALSRMDGAPLVGIELAQGKAYTALSGLSSEDMFNFIKDNPMLLTGVPRISGFVVISGGLPIQIDGNIVGGIGASGGTPEQDVQCAQAGLDALND